MANLLQIQFRAIFEGDDITREAVMQEIKELSKRHLDIAKTPKLQRTQVIVIQDKLAKKWPKLFNDQDRDNRLMLAGHMVGRAHASHRTLSKGPKRNARRTQSAGDGNAGRAQSASMGRKEVTGPNASREKKVVIKEEVTGGPSTKQEKASKPRVPSPVRMAHREEDLPTTLNKNKKDQLPGKDVDVLHFLNSCIPPMGHFLPAFLDYGCHGEYLYAASQWPRDFLANMIRRLALKAGKGITDMEVDTLVAHFQTFFS